MLYFVYLQAHFCSRPVVLLAVARLCELSLGHRSRCASTSPIHRISPPAPNFCVSYPFPKDSSHNIPKPAALASLIRRSYARSIGRCCNVQLAGQTHDLAVGAPGALKVCLPVAVSFWTSLLLTFLQSCALEHHQPCQISVQCIETTKRNPGYQRKLDPNSVSRSSC